MAIAGIPEVINDFNVYIQGNKLLGQTGEVTLPDLEAMTYTIGGAGILGEYEAPVIGRYGSMEQEIPFRCANSYLFRLMNPAGIVELTLRAAVQTVLTDSGQVVENGMRIIFRGRCKKVSMGKAKQGEGMDSSVTLELTYYKVEAGKKTAIELDKLNGVFKLNGIDLLAPIRALT